MEYTNMYVATLTPEQHAKTCNYWYTVQANAFAHVAFTQASSLMLWLEERGLELTAPLAAKGESSWQPIKGSYRDVAHMSYDEFYALQGKRTRAMSNGDYTLAIITDDADGLKTVHTLNPNCHDRPVFDHAETRAMRG